MKFRQGEKSLEQGINKRKEEIKNAMVAFEILAKKLSVLYEKERLTPEEQREVDLILNNAMVIQDILDGKKIEETETTDVEENK